MEERREERTPEDEDRGFEELANLFREEGVPVHLAMPAQPSGPASTAAVADAIVAESAALAMNEIADRLDAIERAVAVRLAKVDRRVEERLGSLDVSTRLDALDHRVDGMVEAVGQLRRALRALGEYVRRLAAAGPAQPPSRGPARERINRVWRETE